MSPLDGIRLIKICFGICYTFKSNKTGSDVTTSKLIKLFIRISLISKFKFLIADFKIKFFSGIWILLLGRNLQVRN